MIQHNQEYIYHKNFLLMKFCIAYCFAVLFLFASCAKDKGNYDYKEVNKLSIADDQGNDLTNRSYSINYNEDLIIKTKVSGSTANFSMKDVAFTWIIDGDTVSKMDNLDVKGSDIGNGKKFGKLVVTDLITDALYSYNFTVNVVASISKGSFILTEDDSHQAYLSMRSVGTNGVYYEFSEFNGNKLGTYPLTLELGSRATSPVDRTYYSLLTATKDGDNPITITDIATLTPTAFYPKSTAMVSGEPFTPTAVFISPQNSSRMVLEGYVVINGKVMAFSNGLVGYDVYSTDEFNYNVGEKSMMSPSVITEGYFLGVFDEANSRIRVFSNGLSSDLYKFNQSLDEVINPNATVGHTFLSASDMLIGDEEWRWQFITKKSNDVYMHNIIMDLSTYEPASFSTVGPKSIANLDKAVQFRFHQGLNYWYFALGRTIYRFSYLGLDIQSYLTLPDDGSGDIVSWNFNEAQGAEYTKIGIATYNPVATGENKGSYYFYDIETKKLDYSELNSIKKAVDIRIGL